MSDFGRVKVRFYSPDDFINPLNGTDIEVLSASTRREINNAEQGTIECVLDSTVNGYAVHGNYAVAHLWDETMDNHFQMACIQIRERTERIENGKTIVTLQGNGPEFELAGVINNKRIGTTFNTTLLFGASNTRQIELTSLGSVETVSVQTVHPGDNRVEVDDTTGFATGDTLIIAYNAGSGGDHIAEVGEVDAVNGWVYFSPAASKSHPSGVKVTVPKVWEGDTVEITLDGGGTFVAKIREQPKLTKVKLDTQIGTGSNAASAGNAVVIYGNKQANTTNDLSLIMSNATSGVFTPAAWTISEAATSTGTSHDPNCATTFELLRAAASASGDAWIRNADGSNLHRQPTRTIKWIKAGASESSGITLSEPTSYTQAQTYWAGTTNGIILGLQRETSKDDIVARVTPYSDAEDGYYNLSYCTSSPPAGYTIGSANGVYYLEKTATVTAGFTRHEVVDFGIKPENDTLSERIDAANRALTACVAHLRNSADVQYFLRVRAVVHKVLEPGQTIALSYTDGVETYSGTYYIVGYTTALSDKGYPYYDLTLSNILTERPSEAKAVASKLSGPSRSSSAAGGGGGGSIIITPTPTSHDPVSLDPTSAPTDGLELTDQVLKLNLIAGDGVEWTDNTLDVLLGSAGGLGFNAGAIKVLLPTNSGLNTSSSGLFLGTPSSVSATSTNNLSGSSHTHAVSATASGHTNFNSLLKVDENGYATVKYLGVNVAASSGNLALNADLQFEGGSHEIRTVSNNLTLKPASTLYITPLGGSALMTSGTELTGSGWVSGFLGAEFGIDTDTGHADFRSIYAEELRVTAFIAEGAFIRAGSQWITPSMAEISRSFTIPAVSSTGTLYVYDIPGYPDLAVFQDDDWILLRVIDRSGGGLLVANVWGQVDNYTDLANGEQSWTFTTRSTTAAGETVSEGLPALCFGKSGDGWIVSTTTDRAGSPYIRTGTWVTNPYTAANIRTHTQMGNLSGLSGVGTAYGLYAGISPKHDRVLVTDRGVQLHGVSLSLYKESNPTSTSLRLYNIALDDGVDTTIYPNGTVIALDVNSSTGSALYTDVNEDPDSGLGTGYIYNTLATEGYVWFELDSISATQANAGVLSIRSNAELAGLVGDSIIQITAQVFKSDNTTPLTEEVLLNTSLNTTNYSKVYFTDIASGESQTTWNAARLLLQWKYKNAQTSEVIRIDPDVPSIALGAGPPTNTNAGGDGIWMGFDTSAYKFRVGGTSFSGSPRMVYDGSNLEFRNGATNDPVIKFDSSGGSYFAGIMTIDTAGEIRQGTGTVGTDFSGMRIRNISSEGIIQFYQDDDWAATFDKDGIKFEASDSAYSPKTLKWYRFSDDTEIAWMGVRSSLGGTGYHPAVGGAAGTMFYSEVSFYVESSFFADGVATFYDEVRVNGGKLSVNLSGDDGIYFQLTSDVDQPFTNLVPTNAYSVMRKVNDTGGGLALLGASSSDIGVDIRGMAETTNSTTGTGGKAPVQLNGFASSGAGVTGVASGDNLVVFRNNFSTQAIIKGNGDFYVNGTSGTYDAYDDLSLVRAVDLETAENTVAHEFDRFVQHNRDDLIALGLLGDDGRMISLTGMMRLHNGALTQLYYRLLELEDKLARLSN